MNFTNMPTQRQIDEAPGGTYNPYGYTSSGDRISNPNPVSNTRYTGPNPVEPTGSLYDQFAERTAENLDLTPADPNKIFQDTLKNYQSTIDALNVSYDNKIRQSEPDRENRLGQQRAIAANAGIQTTPIGSAQEERVRRFNQQEIQNINDERNLLVQEVYGRIRSEAKAEIAAKKQELLGNTQSYLSFLKEQKTSKEADMAKLGAKGTTVKDLKTQDAQGFTKLLSILGIDEADLELQLNSARSEATKLQKVGEHWDDKNGKFIINFYDPTKTGPEAYSQVTKDMNAPEGSKPEYIGGKLYYRLEDGTTLIESESAKADDDRSLDRKYKQSQIDKNYSDMEKTEAERQKILAETTPQAGEKAKEQKLEALSLAKELLTAKGKGSAVGLSAAKLVPFGQSLGLQGERSAYEAKVNTLKSNLTLDNLKLLKGAMSDKDLLFLNAIGSSLTTDMDEASFDAELNKIIGKLEKATGVLPDDKDSADEAYIKQLGL